jgi:amino acid transporter
LHPTQKYPLVSLVTLGGLTAVFCFFSLDLVINAAVTMRIVAQFIAQIAALQLMRRTRPDIAMPFRMWLYPLPSLLALGGWLFVLYTSDAQTLQAAGYVLASGCLAYAIWRGAERVLKQSP